MQHVHLGQQAHVLLLHTKPDAGIMEQHSTLEFSTLAHPDTSLVDRAL